MKNYCSCHRLLVCGNLYTNVSARSRQLKVTVKHIFAGEFTWARGQNTWPEFQVQDLLHIQFSCSYHAFTGFSQLNIQPLTPGKTKNAFFFLWKAIVVFVYNSKLIVQLSQRAFWALDRLDVPISIAISNPKCPKYGISSQILYFQSKFYIQSNFVSNPIFVSKLKYCVFRQ